MFSGRFVGAEEALALGLIDEMVAPDDVYDAALAWAQRFADCVARRYWLPPRPPSQLAPVRLPFMTMSPIRLRYPIPHATAEQVEAARHDSKLAQVLYHDWEAESYDDKWSISYDQRCIDYARGRFDAIVPDEVQRELPYDRALELGCGTGFFLLNLIQAGVARRGSVTDLSPGMVKVATRNGQALGLDVDGRVADAEGIPYEDDTFDLVVGHAVLHHIPDVELSLREVVRVLKPGGRFVFAGEPTTQGQRLRAQPVDADVARRHQRDEAARAEGWRRPQAELDESSRAAALEAIVDLHTFEPGDLERMARNAGAVDVETASEEFTAAMLGWPVRTFEASVPPGRLGWGWAKFAFKSWTTLSWVDANVWRQRRAEGLVLQRDGHRGQAVLSTGLAFSVDDVAYLGGERGRRRSTRSPATGSTDASRIADIASARARFGDRAAVLVETTLLRRKAAAKFADPRRLAVHRRGAAAGDRGRRSPDIGRVGWPAPSCTT